MCANECGGTLSEEWMIRAETPADYDAIDAVILAASGERETVELVRRLRIDGDVLLSLVADIGGHIVGHILMSRVLIDTLESSIPAVALAPLMVEPAHQKKGIGSALTRAALEHCRNSQDYSSAGEAIVLVVGHPTYYPRFGFSAQRTHDLKIPFTLSEPGAFMGLELKAGSLAGVRGKVRYPQAFGL